MKKLVTKSVYVAILPLLATAVVCADGLLQSAKIDSVTAARVDLDDVVQQPATPISNWQQEDSGLGRTLRTHYVRLNENGQLTGVISAIDKSSSSITGVVETDVFLVQRSKVQYQTQTDSSGSFTTDPVEPGTYTLCVAGKDGFLAYGIHVVPDDQAGENLPVPLPGATEQDKPNGPNSNISLTTKLQDQARVNITAAVVPPKFSTLQQIMTNYVPTGVAVSLSAGSDSRINVEKSVVVGGFQINLTKDGNLKGRISPLGSNKDQPIRLREMNVFLILDDEVYAQVSVEDNGRFEFSNIEPGVYGFAAAGRDGFAAMSFQAVAPDQPTTDLQDTSTNPDSPFQTASAANQQNGADELEVAISPSEDSEFLRDKINELNDGAVADQPVVAPIPGFGPPPVGGGAFGGPGGAGTPGLSEFGGIFQAALAAWVLAEGLSNSDNLNNVLPPPVILPPPVSPFN